MKRTKWVEREFEFNLPVGVFPSVLERLRGTPARLEEMVRALPARALTERGGEAWTGQEQARHPRGPGGRPAAGAGLGEVVRAPPARAVTERVGEAWTVQEQVGHLLDLDELHEGRL